MASIGYREDSSNMFYKDVWYCFDLHHVFFFLVSKDMNSEFDELSKGNAPRLME
jgi:hypothetical protein